MGTGSSFTPRENLTVELTGNTDQYVKLVVVDDGTPTAGWPNRFEIWFGSVLVGWLNEFGEIRWIGSAPNRVAARLTAKNLPTDPDRTANMLEFRDNQVDQNLMLGVDGQGELVGPKGFSPWETIALDPAFAAGSGGGYRAPEIRFAPGGMIELRGRMTATGAWVANTSVLATVDVEYRPTAPVQLLIRASSTMANLIVNTDGTIVSAQAVTAGSNASVEGLRYSR